MPDGREVLAFRDLQIAHADGNVVIGDANAEIAAGEKVLIVGESGTGKSTLFRAIAGLWPWGSGRIRIPPRSRMMFMPQRPYLPLGTLRRALCYPRDASAFSDDEVRAALADAGLGHLAGRLDGEESWSHRLSGGEQQRVALARALLLKPDWLFLDEATASLDPDSEARFYALLKERLPGTTLVSIAHRPAVARFHDRALRVREGRLVEAAAPAADAG
jgi:putative ATP-binding cassette transporter